MDKEVSIVLSKERRNFRKIAQKWYGLTDEQMIGMDVHHNPPRCEGGRNIPEHLFIYHSTLHAAVHEDSFILWAREGTKKAGVSVSREQAAIWGREGGRANGKKLLGRDKNNMVVVFNSAHEASTATGIHRGNICTCCRGGRKSAGGWKWSYLG